MNFLKNLLVEMNKTTNRTCISFDWEQKFIFEDLARTSDEVKIIIAKMIADKYVKENYRKVFSKLNKNELANLTAVKIATEIAKGLVNKDEK